MSDPSGEQPRTFDEMLEPPAMCHPHLLVVIEHNKAQVYKTELRGSVPQRILPYDPYGYGRQTKCTQTDAGAQHKSERGSFRVELARKLQGAEAILIFGHGPDATSVMHGLIDELKQHYPDLAKHVIGSRVVDRRRLSPTELMAKVREVYGQLEA
jgi:hypothetical protein